MLPYRPTGLIRRWTPAVLLLAVSLVFAGCRGGGESIESQAGAEPREGAIAAAGSTPQPGEAPRAKERLTPEALKKEVLRLASENDRLQKRLDKLTPSGPYIVINTTLNRLYLRKGDQTLVDAVCSTGSNTELIDPNGKRRWFFSTPKGVFTVKTKMIAPVWVKPDWAFIEEGEPVPGPQAAERFEEGFLGRYGLYFGNGYLIHGTLFQRHLGQSVTHGCVRLGDADLEKVYENSKVGTKIFIY